MSETACCSGCGQPITSGCRLNDEAGANWHLDCKLFEEREQDRERIRVLEEVLNDVARALRRAALKEQP